MAFFQAGSWEFCTGLENAPDYGKKVNVFGRAADIENKLAWLWTNGFATST